MFEYQAIFKAISPPREKQEKTNKAPADSSPGLLEAVDGVGLQR